MLLVAGDWLMNSDVELLPPAFTSTVFANSNMKCADASLGWFGKLGMMRLLLDLYLNIHQKQRTISSELAQEHMTNELAHFLLKNKFFLLENTTD